MEIDDDRSINPMQSEENFKTAPVRADSFKTANIENLGNRNSAGGANLSISEAYTYLETTVARRVIDTNQKSNYRLALPGETVSPETNQPAERYAFFSSANALDEFGVGVGVYFRTLKIFFFVFLVIGLINLVSLTKNKEGNPDNTSWNLEGSVFGLGRLDLEFDSQVAADIGITLFLMLFIIVATQFEDNVIADIDARQQTTQDYSVWVKNPLPEVDDPQEYYDVFKQFGEVVSITIAKKNGDLIDALAERKACITRKDHLAESGITEGNYNVTWSRWLARLCGLVRSPNQLEQRIKELDQIILSKSALDYEPWRVFVTFNNETDQKYCLKNLNFFAGGELGVNTNATMRGEMLIVEEAPEPSSVIYTSSHQTETYKYLSWLISYTFAAGLVLASYFIIKALVASAPDVVAIFVVALNASLPALLKFLSQYFEVHDTMDSQQTSILLKLLVVRCLTATVLIYVATPYEKRFGLDELGAMQQVLLLDCFFGPVLRMLDPVNNILRYFVGPAVCLTQDELNHFFEATQWTLAERYTDVMKTAVVGLFYAVPLPSGLFITSLAMFITYCADKWSLYHVWAKPPMLDAKLAIVARYFFGFSVWMHAAISLNYFANWPFPADTDEVNCTAFLCQKTDFMTDDQKKSIDTYGTFSIFLFIVVAIWYFNYYVRVGLSVFLGRSFMGVEDEADISSIPFRKVTGEHFYIPQVDRLEMMTPVIACDVRELPETRYPGAVENVYNKRAVRMLDKDTDEEAVSKRAPAYTMCDPKEFKMEAGAKAENILRSIFSVVKYFKPAAFNTRVEHQRQTTAGFFMSALGSMQAQVGLRKFNADKRSSIRKASIGSDPNTATPAAVRGQVRANPVADGADTRQLPPGWEQATHSDGRTYYVNHNTQKTTWNFPSA